MGTIDEVKEILTSLRVGLSIVVGLLVVVLGATIKLERNNELDIYFYIGLIVSLVLVFIFLKIVKYIREYTKKIRDL